MVIDIAINRLDTKTIYKIYFGFQQNVQIFLNIYFLTTIRFFSCFSHFVYTLYIHTKNQFKT